MPMKRHVQFEFSQDHVQQPLLYHLNRNFDVVVNIRGASVTEEGGFIALELEGEEAEIERVFEYLRNQDGIGISEGSQRGSGAE